MLKHLTERHRDDRGFTLIELMVVVLIIGILLAIAVPSFLGAQDTAKDTAAKADLRNAYTTAKVFQASNDGSYSGFDADTGADLEPSLPWDDMTVTANTGDVTITMESGSGKTCTATDVGGPVSVTCA